MAVKGSIVDYLKEQGQDSSYAARQKLAQQYGISGYSGTAAQNTALLSQLQSANQQASAPSAPEATQTSQNVSGTSSNSGPGTTSSVSGSRSYSSGRASYTPSAEVEEYRSILRDYENEQPDAFESRYDDQIQTILNGILNREDFSYDMNNDQLYQQYKESYMRQGQQAMRDTIAQASALTGGYGSTYAQTAGSQAYDQYLMGLNDKVPELYQIAYDMYQDEGNEMYNQLSALQGLDDTDYSRYRDEVNDYFTNRDYYNTRYNQEYGYDYGQYQDELAQENWEEEFAYQQEQDALAQQNWEAEFAYQKEQDAIANQLAMQRLAASSSKSSSGNTSTSKTTSGYAPIAASIVEKAKANDWSNLQKWEYAAQLVDKGILSRDDFDDVVQAVGIDEEAVTEEMNRYNKLAMMAPYYNPKEEEEEE